MLNLALLELYVFNLEIRWLAGLDRAASILGPHSSQAFDIAARNLETPQLAGFTFATLNLAGRDPVVLNLPRRIGLTSAGMGTNFAALNIAIPQPPTFRAKRADTSGGGRLHSASPCGGQQIVLLLRIGGEVPSTFQPLTS